MTRYVYRVVSDKPLGLGRAAGNTPQIIPDPYTALTQRDVVRELTITQRESFLPATITLELIEREES